MRNCYFYPINLGWETLDCKLILKYMNIIGNITSGIIAAVVSAIVSYWIFKRQQFNDTITKERLNFIKDWRECAACFCGLLALKNESFEVDEFEGHKLE